jgi:hypothetical protein
MIPACSEVIKEKPGSYLHRIYYDSVVYAQDAPTAVRVCDVNAMRIFNF